MKILKIVLLLFLALPNLAHAWWNKDWKQRTAITLNTSAAGMPTQQAVTGMAVVVRLHSGNFDFLSAKPDGADLRAVAGDDKTPLKFWIERFDSVNELAVLWVQIPAIAPGSDKNVFYIYAGNEQASAGAVDAGVFDPSTIAAFHFAEKDGVPADQTGTIRATGAVPTEVNGLIGPSAHPSGSAIVWPGSDKTKFAPGAPLTISLWVKPSAASGTLFSEGPLAIALTAGALTASIGQASVTGGQIAPAVWSHVALVLVAGKATLYVNAEQTGQADLGASAAALEGDLRAGEGYQGLIDELEISGAARSQEWLKVAFASQSADAKLIATKSETADAADGKSGGGGYFGILIRSLTPDAWVVIGVLAVMFAIAVAVMVAKARYVTRTESANRRFLSHYRSSNDVLAVGSADAAGEFRDSSLYRLYRAGVVELNKRDVGKDGRTLSGASLDAVKAAIDADSVREGYKLNAQMVLLTIAIAGGPFLGLLGTVVGVMITFAAIAAAGDVNVNAIAPGIAAALLATVAGLSVAIPSLFGYNYLASRIKTISSDMQIFIDEFVTRVAEAYGSR